MPFQPGRATAPNPARHDPTALLIISPWHAQSEEATSKPIENRDQTEQLNRVKARVVMKPALANHDEPILISFRNQLSFPVIPFSLVRQVVPPGWVNNLCSFVAVAQIPLAPAETAHETTK